MSVSIQFVCTRKNKLGNKYFDFDKPIFAKACQFWYQNVFTHHTLKAITPFINQ